MKKNNSTQQVSKRNKSFLAHLLPLFVLLLSVNGLLAQQVIGSFPTMDGGFEGQAASGTSLAGTSIGTGVQRTDWTTSSGSLGTFQTTSPRTGGKYVNINFNSTTKRLQSPTAPAGAIVSGTANYTVQFWYRTASATAPGGGNNQAGASTDGTNPTSSMSYTTFSPAITGTSGLWTKASTTINTANSTNPSPKYGYLCPYRTATAMAAAIEIDDVCMYLGVLDVTSPDVATSALQASVAATQQTISWTAPETGVDGGGYIVVRGLSDPTTTPNVNGIYAVGNFVAGTEKVVYLGTNTSFVDLGLTPSTTYYYRIYTVDKAFNYSAAATLTASTGIPSYAAEPTVQATIISFANVTSTSFDINWTAGDGTNSLVVVRAGSAVDADPTDGGTYAPALAYGSGTPVGIGNYSVYNGTGNSVTITGLSKTITYYVKVYTFNGASGSENYLLTGAASANQMAAPGEIISTGSNTPGTSYSTGSAWVGGVAPTRYDNVTIASGDIFNVGSTQACYNLTIQSGGKIAAGTAQTFQIYGSSLVCDGTFGDPSNTVNQMTVDYGGNLVISGTGAIYPYKLRPVTGLSNIGVTFDANTTITYGTVGLQSQNTANDNDNVTITINAGKTVTMAGSLSTTSSQTGVGNGNTTLNVYGTLNVGPTLNTTVASGKTYTINVNGGTLTATKLNITPSHAVVAPAITVTSPGILTATGLVDCSNTALTAAVTGTGTFNLNSGATINTSSATGLEPVAGPIRTSVRNFNTGANYGFVGNVPQVLGSDFPATVNNLTLNNTAGLNLSASTLVNGALTLTAGELSLGNNDLTLGASGTISGGSATAYIATNGTGKLIQPVAAATAKLFPIGTADAYAPVEVTPADATNFSVKVGTTFSSGSNTQSGTTFNPFEWDITPDAASSTVVKLTPSTNLPLLITDVIGHWNGSSYDLKRAVRTDLSYSATFTSFSPFVTGTSDLGTSLNNDKERLNVISTKNNIHIIGTSIGDNIKVYSATGQCIHNLRATANETKISATSGIYLVKVNNVISKIVL